MQARVHLSSRSGMPAAKHSLPACTYGQTQQGLTPCRCCGSAGQKAGAAPYMARRLGAYLFDSTKHYFQAPAGAAAGGQPAGCPQAF